MRECALILLTLLTFFGGELQAARVLGVRPEKNEVIFAHEPDRKWERNDEICIYRKDVRVGCGKVIAVDSKSAVAYFEIKRQKVTQRTVRDDSQSTFVELTFGKDSPKKGDDVRTLFPEPEVEDPETMRALIEGFASLQRDPSSVEEPDMSGREDLLWTVRTRDPDNEDALYHHYLSNFTFGLNYIFPNLQYQQALSNSLATGLMPKGKASVIGGF